MILSATALSNGNNEPRDVVKIENRSDASAAFRSSGWGEAMEAIRKLSSAASNANGVLDVDDTSQVPWFSAFSNPNITRMQDSFDWASRLEHWREEVTLYTQELSDNVTLSTLSNFIDPVASSPYPMSTSSYVVPAKSATESPFPPQEQEAPSESLLSSYLWERQRAPSLSSILPHTSLYDTKKHCWIVTTAALPWMTGTAVNPLLRAAYLCRSRLLSSDPDPAPVTLMLPWLERPSDQRRVYGKNNVFSSPEHQEVTIREWLRDTANMPAESRALRIRWYVAWQNVAENSVYSMGDITALIPDSESDVCVLEEPEHLNWYRAPGEAWTTKFKHVVGVVHTNYFVYAQEQPAALIRAPAMRLLCSWMVRAHCHKAIKLSAALDVFAPEKEIVENVHGVRQGFLDTGRLLAQKLEGGSDILAPIEGFDDNFHDNVYFIGKMLWSKGIGTLMDLLDYAEDSAGLKVKIDMYGSGPDTKAAESKANKMNVNMEFHGAIDHAQLGKSHKVFVNPSTSEVLCTTVAEALAMGKFVVLPSHPSNDFFCQFPNCLPYSNEEEFVGNLYYAITHSPEPMSKEYLHMLSWEAATERFKAASAITTAEYETMQKLNEEIKVSGGVEFNLPMLIEDETTRKEVSEVLQRSRSRFRAFRDRLSAELSDENNPLPMELRIRLKAELDKRLDLQLEEMIESPRMKTKLSPGELDKALLDLYNSVTKGPGGDLLRVIGGGTEVGQQVGYMRRSRWRQRRQRWRENFAEQTLQENSFLPSSGRRAAQNVQAILQTNLKRHNEAVNAAAVPFEKEDRGNVDDNDHKGRSTKMNMQQARGVQRTVLKTRSGFMGVSLRRLGSHL